MRKLRSKRQPGRSLIRSAMFGMVLALLMGVLLACGAATPEAGTTDPTAPAATDPTTPAGAVEPTANTSTSGPVTVRWLVWSDDVSKEKNLQDEIAMYNASQSEVKVELIGAGWNDFTPKLQALVAADTPPDVVSIQNEADFVSKGFMLPLEELMAKDSLDKSRFLPGSLEPAYDGKVYGFRHDTAYWLLYYNKDMFDAAGVAYPPETGWTIEQFMDAACQLSKPAENQWGMHNVHWLTGILTQQQGLPYLEMVDGAPQYKLDAPETMAFYQKVGDFINKQNCQPTVDQNSSFGGADPFMSGRAAMSFNGNWGFGNVKDNATFKWAVAPLPGLKQPNVGMKIGIVRASKNQEAAWKFLKWLTYEPEATRFRSEKGMGQPAIVDEQAIQAFLKGPSAPEGLESVFKILAAPENSFRVLDVPGASEANNMINPASDEIMNGLGQASDVLPEAVKKANEVLKEQWTKATATQ